MWWVPLPFGDILQMEIFERGVFEVSICHPKLWKVIRQKFICSSEKTYPKDLAEDGTQGIRCNEAWLANTNLLKQLISFLQQMVWLKTCLRECYKYTSMTRLFFPGISG